MRLHQLTVEGFGPFPGRVDVDFDALSASGIFLIHGATGAGKTTLLDAVCFALYAGVPGARPGGRSLRSDHADPGTVPRVELDLTVGGRRLLVTRSPEFTRAKRRGTGTTTVPAAVTLRERVRGAWAPLSTRADEVGALVRDLVGLGLDQFATVVLLPQGEFAAFLRACPEFRRELLERLFDVRRFTDVEEGLAARRRHATGALTEAEALLAVNVRRAGDVVARVPGRLLDLPVGEQVPVADVGAAVGALVADVEAAAAAALVERDTAEARERAARAALDDAVRTEAWRSRGAQARATLVELDERAPTATATAAALTAGRRAAALAGDVRALTDAAARGAAARDRVTAAAAAVADAGLPPVTDLPAARALTAAVSALDGCLAEAGHLERVRADAEERRRAAEQARAAAARTHADTVAAADRRADTLTVLIESHRSATQDAPDVAAAQRQVSERTTRVQWRRDLAEHDEQRRRAEVDRREAAAAYLDARSRWLDVREAHVEGVAARLAADLVPGAPCPVCGSADHPSPATGADPVPDSAVAGAESAVALAQDRLSTAEADVARSEGQAAAVRAQLGGPEGDAAQEEAALAAAVQREQAATAHARRVGALDEQVAAARTAVADERVRAAQAGAGARAAAARVEALDEQVARAAAGLHERLSDHARRCPCARGEVTGGAHVRARHGAAAAALGEAAGAVATLGEAGEEQARTAREVTRRLTQAGFASVADVAAATVPEGTLAAYEEALAQVQRRRVAAQTVVEDPHVRAALAADPVDVDVLGTGWEQAHRARREADGRHAVTEVCARELAAAASAVAGAALLVTERAERHARTARLADTVGGLGPDNTLRMRLSSFVLAARLERVVDLANERLGVLGDGRYRLRHTDARTPGTGRSGLGLTVEDLWTGYTRDTATLSGGETFLASLALALGLADAVREEAGGFDLQTLFVDEGFATLDEATLEQVLGVLDQLRDGGRAVGVVSHVADLQARIPDQLRVDKSADGSTVTVVGAAGRLA